MWADDIFDECGPFVLTSAGDVLRRKRDRDGDWDPRVSEWIGAFAAGSEAPPDGLPRDVAERFARAWGNREVGYRGSVAAAYYGGLRG